MEDFYKKTVVSESEIKLEVTLPVDLFTQTYSKLLQDRAKTLDIKGFRKGNTPTNLVESSMENMLLAETFERVAPYYVNAAIIKEKLEPISAPEYSDLKEIKKDEPVTFTVKVTVMPNFKLGNLKKIKVDKKDPEVKDSEIQEALEIMKKNNDAIVNKDAKKDNKKETKMDDEWAKKIGEIYQFPEVKKLDDLKEKIKKLLLEQKKNLLQQAAISDAITQAVELSNIKIPEVGVKYEAQQREEAFMKDLEKMKMSLKDFLTTRNIKQEELKDRWEKDSKEALETDVLLKIYAKEKNVNIEEDELKGEVKKIKESAKQHYEKQHAGHDHESHFDESVYDNPQWQEQIKGYLVKQKAYQKMMEEILGADFMKPAIPEEAEKSATVEKGDVKGDSKNTGNK